MIRPIVRDVFFLRQKSEPATQGDLSVDRDLRDTLQANREKCVGMAANMIGVRKRVIIVSLGFADTVMYNPVLLSKDTPYEAEEGCLSLEGVRPVKRYNKIKVKYQTPEMQLRYKSYTGWTAEIIQHEIDHIAGIII